MEVKGRGSRRTGLRESRQSPDGLKGCFKTPGVLALIAGCRKMSSQIYAIERELKLLWEKSAHNFSMSQNSSSHFVCHSMTQVTAFLCHAWHPHGLTLTRPCQPRGGHAQSQFTTHFHWAHCGKWQPLELIRGTFYSTFAVPPEGLLPRRQGKSIFCLDSRSADHTVQAPVDQSKSWLVPMVFRKKKKKFAKIQKSARLLLVT